MHILSLVLGTIGVVLIFVPLLGYLLSPVLSCAAIVTGILGRVLFKNRGHEDDLRMTTAGLTLGIVGMGLCVLLYVSSAYLFEKVFRPRAERWKVAREMKQVTARIDRLEKKIEAETSRFEEELDATVKRIEKGISSIEGREGRKDRWQDDCGNVAYDFKKKMEEMKGEIKKWEEWLESMPIFEKRGNLPTQGGGKEESPSRPGTPESKKKREGYLKKPNIIKEIPQSKDNKLLTPYDYY